MLGRLLLALALALLCSSDCRAAPEGLELPGDFAVAPVMQRLVLNGLPLEAAVFTAALAPQQACNLIKRQWSRVRPAAVIGCQKNGDWLLVTRRAGSKVQTAQFRQSAAGVTGFISQLDLRAQVLQSATPRLPLPRGTRLVSVLQSAGPEGESRQFTLVLPLTPEAALRQLNVNAGRLGWQSTVSAAQSPREGMFEFMRGSERIQAIVVRNSNGSGVVLIEHGAAGRQP